jgi:hypothetical protein
MRKATEAEIGCLRTVLGVDSTNEETKVPLRVDWLAENEMLIIAGRLLGYTIKPYYKKGNPAADEKGIMAMVEGAGVLTTSGMRKQLEHFKLLWEDHLLFTLSQLAELGFALGNTTSLSGAIARHELLESSLANI